MLAAVQCCTACLLVLGLSRGLLPVLSESRHRRQQRRCRVRTASCYTCLSAPSTQSISPSAQHYCEQGYSTNCAVALAQESALRAPPKNLRKISSKGQGKTSTQGATIEHKIHTQMNRIKIPEDTRREGPPFPRIQGTSSSNCHGKILTLERRKGNQLNKKETEGGDGSRFRLVGCLLSLFYPL